MFQHLSTQHNQCLALGNTAYSLWQVQASLKAKGLRDDITVLVVDAMPDDSYRLPPCLVKMSGHTTSVEEVGPIDWHRPLEESGALELCQSKTW